MIESELPQYITATILDGKMLLKPKKCKNTIIESMKFLVQNNRVLIYSFCIMDNHMHLIWQMKQGNKAENVQRDFLKHLAQQFKKLLKINDKTFLEQFKVSKKDRNYQFSQRKPLSVELYSKEVFEQKLEYIHYNPVKAGLCNLPEEYYYSSANFYHIGIDVFGFLSHSEV
jgi:REP element-mobilizing transposase RayT